MNEKDRPPVLSDDGILGLINEIHGTDFSDFEQLAESIRDFYESHLSNLAAKIKAMEKAGDAMREAIKAAHKYGFDMKEFFDLLDAWNASKSPL